MNFYYIKSIADRFLEVRDSRGLAAFLNVPPGILELTAENISYNEFWVAKASGGKRKIEDPAPVLKTLLDKLADAFQAVYFFHRTDSSYGFQWTVDNEKLPRNIKTNAERHLHKKWMYNADLKDFFHQVSRERLVQLFCSDYFGLPFKIAELLARLCTYKERLPMGAPSSPALSNWAAHDLDEDLEKYTDSEQITYTRYVDDFTFSRFDIIDDHHVRAIHQLTRIHGFDFNPEKCKLYGPDTVKTVTGIRIGDKVTVQEDFLKELEDDIVKYTHTMEVNHRSGFKKNEYLSLIQQQIEGKLRFISFIHGLNDDHYQSLRRKYHKAMETDQYDVLSWREFDYHYLIPGDFK